MTCHSTDINCGIVISTFNYIYNILLSYNIWTLKRLLHKVQFTRRVFHFYDYLSHASVKTPFIQIPYTKPLPKYPYMNKGSSSSTYVIYTYRCPVTVCIIYPKEISDVVTISKRITIGKNTYTKWTVVIYSLCNNNYLLYNNLIIIEF